MPSRVRPSSARLEIEGVQGQGVWTQIGIGGPSAALGISARGWDAVQATQVDFPGRDRIFPDRKFAMAVWGRAPSPVRPSDAPQCLVFAGGDREEILRSKRRRAGRRPCRGPELPGQRRSLGPKYRKISCPESDSSRRFHGERLTDDGRA